MANLMGFVWLSLIATILFGSAAKADFGRRGYFTCEPERPYQIRSELDKRLYGHPMSNDEFRVLIEGSKGQMIGDITVEEVLELDDISVEKCNFDELMRRNHYRRINPGSRAQHFITDRNEAMKSKCAEMDHIREKIFHEFKNAIKEDRIIIKSVQKGAESESGGFDYRVQEASKRYVQSFPGKSKFVKQARRLRILHACNHYIETYNSLGQSLNKKYLPKGTVDICESLIMNQGEKLTSGRLRRNLELAGKIAKKTATVSAVAGVVAGIIAAGIAAPVTIPAMTTGTLLMTLPVIMAGDSKGSSR